MALKKDSLFTKDFLLLWGANFLMALSFYFLLPTLPLFATQVLGAKESQVGLITGIYTLAALMMRPLAGYALDVKGRRLVYLLALAAFALIIPLYHFSSGLLLLLLLRFIHGSSWGVTTVAGGTIVADILPPKRRGEGVGIFGLSMTIGMALGPGLGLGILQDDHYGRLFLSSALLAGTGLLLALFIRYPLINKASGKITWEAMVDRQVLPISLLMFFSALAYGGLVSFITIFSREEIGLGEAGFFFLVYAAALSIIRPLSGRLMDRRGPYLITILGYLFSLAGYLLLAGSYNLPPFLTSAILIGAGNGMVWPTLMTMVINIVEPARRGVANSTFYSFLDLGIGLGSILLGWLADLLSIRMMYAVSGLLFLLPLILFLSYVFKDYLNKLEKAQREIRV